jgi:hypothetical protein
MGDDEAALQPVGRSHRPGLWIGAWVIGLAAVVAVAVAGRGGAVEDVAAVPAATPMASVAPLAIASPSIPPYVPRIIRPLSARAPAPRPSPTLGDDGLVGGQVYSSARPGG